MHRKCDRACCRHAARHDLPSVWGPVTGTWPTHDLATTIKGAHRGSQRRTVVRAWPALTSHALQALVLTVSLRSAVAAYDAMRTVAEATHAAPPSTAAAAQRLSTARLAASPASASAALRTPPRTPPFAASAQLGQVPGSDLLRRGLNWSGGGAALSGVAKALRPSSSSATPPPVAIGTPPQAGDELAVAEEPATEQVQAQAQMSQNQLAVMVRLPPPSTCTVQAREGPRCASADTQRNGQRLHF